MVLTPEDAPQWLKDESLRKKWAEINNARLRVWTPGAPACVDIGKVEARGMGAGKERHRGERINLPRAMQM